MPLGTLHDQTGLLMCEEGWLVLQRDDGGRWRLDTLKRVEDLLSKRVCVRGTRGDFDILDVNRIDRC